MSTTTRKRTFASSYRQTDSLAFVQLGKDKGRLLTVVRVLGRSRPLPLKINRHLADVQIETSARVTPMADVDTNDSVVQVTASRSAGIPYQDLGWTREQFEAAADRLSHLRDVWDHDELDVYNDLL